MYIGSTSNKRMNIAFWPNKMATSIYMYIYILEKKLKS